jgi:hypothetical protein
MNALVAADSYYGAASQIALAIAAALGGLGWRAEAADLRNERWDPRELDGLRMDLLVVGGPTRMGYETLPARRFVRRLQAESWEDTVFAVFDTYVPRNDSQHVEDGAALNLLTLLERRRLLVHPEVLRCRLSKLDGPLAQGELERARFFAWRLAAAVPERPAIPPAAREPRQGDEVAPLAEAA